MSARREKVFGSGRAVPLDRNAKARVMLKLDSSLQCSETKCESFQ